MDIRPLSDTYSVAPQIAPDDAAAIRAAGFTTVICNRPDAENPPELRMDAIRAAVEAEGLRFVENPFAGNTLSSDNVAAHRDAIAAADGPVLAYCASGNRSAIVWALAHAGERPTDELIKAGTQYGYQTESFRKQIEQLAAERA